MPRLAGYWMFVYAAIAFVVSLAAAMYLPETGEIALNPRAKSALVAGGVTSALMLLWGFLAVFGYRWAVPAGLITTGVMSLAFGWRAFLGWTAVAEGAEEKWYAATMISVLFLTSVLVFIILAILNVRSAGAGHRSPSEVRSP